MKAKVFYTKSIPSDWTSPEFGQVFSFLGTFSFSRDQLTNDDRSGKVQCIHYGDIHAKFEDEILDFDQEIEIPYVLDGLIEDSELEDEEFPALKNGDLVVADASEDYAGLAESIEISNIADRIVVAGLHTFAARDKKEKTAEGFRTYLLRHDQVIREIRRIASGISVHGVSKSNLSKVNIALPPLPEQNAIARVLGRMDELISKTNRLIEQKKLRKKYLTQTLLTGKKRLKGFRKKWNTYPFRELAIESAFRNGGKMSNDRLMAVYKTHGMIPMRERVQGESNHRCKVVRQNYFAYNPMRLNIGSLARWDGEEPAMVSGDYVVFKCEEERLDPRFFDFYRSTNEWANYVRRAGDGSVRVRIYFSHLAPLKITLPSIEEQKAIANILDIATCEITMLEAKSELLKMQKKWLMQQLLTGKKRLQTEEAS